MEMPEPDQPLPVALEALRVEHLDGDLRGRVPLAHGAVDDPSVHDAEAALADDLPRVELAGGLPELVASSYVKSLRRPYADMVRNSSTSLGTASTSIPSDPTFLSFEGAAAGLGASSACIRGAIGNADHIYISSMDAKRRLNRGRLLQVRCVRTSTAGRRRLARLADVAAAREDPAMHFPEDRYVADHSAWVGSFVRSSPCWPAVSIGGRGRPTRATAASDHARAHAGERRYGVLSAGSMPMEEAR